MEKTVSNFFQVKPATATEYVKGSRYSAVSLLLLCIAMRLLCLEPSGFVVVEMGPIHLLYM